MIVLELCSYSLRYLVMSHPKNAPARLSSEAVKKKVLGWTLNILDALQYIHGEGFVHRDLNLDNILVSCILFQDPLLLSVFSKHFPQVVRKWINFLT